MNAGGVGPVDEHVEIILLIHICFQFDRMLIGILEAEIQPALVAVITVDRGVQSAPDIRRLIAVG